MTRHPIRQGRAAALLAVAGLAIAGCTSAAAPPTETMRSAAATAPADLQLTCASAAAESYGVPADRVLPTGSGLSPSGNYDIQLDVAGTRAVCTIDDNGNVLGIANV